MSDHAAAHALARQREASGQPGEGAPRAPHALLLSRTSVTAAWSILMLAVVHPPHGLGVSLCLFRATTGVPCWGCGLSRSVSCALRGMLAESWTYHPFGPILLMILAGIAITSVLPARTRSRVALMLDRHPRATVGIYGVFVTLFVTYGTLRTMICLL